ncbi:MAG: tRNA dihydrouridine synthase DusB [Gammaproteobacteria bacterium]|nr:tRNA dihydrouridine synthase DusB [Gammaproteobacteria bacterium]
MKIGPHLIDPPLILAPMAGVTDKPFRLLARRLGAGLAVSEMTIADARLWGTRKSRQRMDHSGEPGPVSVQIAGYDPQMLADAARHNVALGADIIDINMGCPAKKVCNVASGSALLRDEPLVARILEAVVAAVAVPVTLKMRTGYTRGERNALTIARLAEAAGIAAIAVHGRTREDHFNGAAEFDTVAAVKAAVGIPVIANGDIATPEQARAVFDQTGCDALMIARAAQGRPWIFREIAHFLATGAHLPEPGPGEVGDILLGHVAALHEFYGPQQGLRIARKHIGWYTDTRPDGEAFRSRAIRIADAADQLDAVRGYFDALPDGRAAA